MENSPVHHPFPRVSGRLVGRPGLYPGAWDFLAFSWVAALLILIFLVEEGAPCLPSLFKNPKGIA